MGNNVTPNYIRGFLLPLDVGPSNIWTAQSSFTQEGSTAGNPSPAQASKMRLLATGEQSNNGNLTIVTRKAGSSGFGARFTFKENVSSTTTEYGRDTYNSISGFKFQKLAGTTTTQYYAPTAFVTNKSTLLVTYQNTSTTNIKRVGVNRIDKGGGDTSQNIFTILSGFTVTQMLHPCICQLNDDSLILCHIYEDNGYANIRVHRSTDDGVTWSVVARESLDVPIPVGTASGAGVNTYDIQRLRIASNGDTIVLLLGTELNNTSSTKRNVLHQYVSIDGGGTFTKISTDTNLSSNSFISVDLAIRNGRFVVSYIADTSNVHFVDMPNPFSNIHLLRQSSSYAQINTPNAANGTNDFMTDGEMCMAIDDDGGIYIYVYSHGSNDYFLARHSFDGSTFRYMNGNFSVANGTLINQDDATTRLMATNVKNWLGRNLIVSNAVASSSVDNSVIFTFVGGYSDVNLPRSTHADADVDWARIGYIRSFLPLDEPSAITGLTAVGTGNDSISNGLLRITSNVTYPNARYYNWNNLPTSLVNSNYIGQGLIIRASLYTVSGGDFTNNYRGFSATTDDGTDKFQASVYLSTTQIQIYDNIASSALATVSIDTTAGVDILLAMSNGVVSVWYRAYSYSELRDWTNATQNTTLSRTGSSAAGQIIHWGHLAYHSGTIETDWNEFHVSTLDAVGINMSDGFSNPSDCSTRPYPPIGQYAYIYDGVKISSSDGPTYEGEEFNITPQFDYPIDNIFYNVVPTPRIGWRSQPVTSGNVASQSVAIKLDETDYTTSYVDSMGNDLMGFHLNGINWENGDLYYHNGTTWALLAAIDNSIRVGCSVSGRTCRGNASQTQPYFTLNELVDWTCYFPTGEDTKVFRKITANTEGKFGGTGGTTKQCTVYFDEAPPQTATDIYLIPPIITIVVSMNGKKASGFKIVTDAQETFDNDIRIGEIILGPVVVAGRQYSRGRSITQISGTTTTETPDGIRYAREVQPPKRNFRIAWTDGIDISQLQGLEPDIDYWTASNQAGFEPIAVNNEVPDLMLGFLRYVQGGKKHFVYIPNITKSTSAPGDIRVLNRDKEMALVTLDNDISIEHVVGNELQTQNGEVFRVANMSFTEVK